MSTLPPLSAVVLSGGLDSATALARCAEAKPRHRLLAITVDYGQRHVREIESAAAIAGHYGAEHLVIDVAGLGAVLTGSALTDPAVPVPAGHYAQASMAATVVPNRNAILANLAVAVAMARGAAAVVLGVHAGDHYVYPDCRPAFFDALRRAVAVGNEGFAPPAILTPFLSWSKATIVATAADLGVPVELTWSCYAGGERHCGVCGTCYERREAFDIAGVPDPTGYADATTRFPAPARP